MERASCLILKDDKILLVKKRDTKHWELPGDYSHQADQDLALDHAKKTSGLSARIVQLFGIYEYQEKGKNFESHVYEADLLKEEQIRPDPDFQADWFSIKDIPQNLSQEADLVLNDL
jgi:ADP-ribose pyrophosphatase YjhB (NUDIX family)